MALFGKLVKYVVAKGMKLLPNFIGRTSAQAQADVVSEGFTLGNVTTTLSGEPTELANDGKVVEQIPAVTTPADYETPVDLTVRQFSFTPFGVFGFSPF
jgi:beta-lactam-binding protein with PASTA domain